MAGVEPSHPAPQADLSPRAQPSPEADLSRPCQLSPRVIVLWRLRALGWVLALAVATTLPGALAGSIGLLAGLPAAVLVVGGTLAWTLPAVAHRRWRYELTDTTVELRHGIVVVVESSIPHFRVQHVDVRDGPIERWLGIARLDIATASSATDASIPGIEADRAEAVRRHVLERAETAEGV